MPGRAGGAGPQRRGRRRVKRRGTRYCGYIRSVKDRYYHISNTEGAEMKNSERLERYDVLRKFHKELHKMWNDNGMNMDSEERNAFEALDSVLYLVEGVYARQE